MLFLYRKAESGVYKIQAETKSNYTEVYCEMTSFGECANGGWTLLMKINGSQYVHLEYFQLVIEVLDQQGELQSQRWAHMF